MLTRSPNSDTYARALASVYHAGPRLWDPSYALAQDPDVDEKVLRDPVIRKCCEVRQLRAAGVEWHLKPASDEPIDRAWSKALEECIREVDGFAHARKNLADGIIKGRAYAYVEGDFGIGFFGDGAPRRWWIPRRLRDVDRRRFRKVVKTRTETRILTTWNIFSLAKRQWVSLDETNDPGFIRFVYNDEEDTLGYGRGLLDSLYFPWFFRGTALQEGIAGLERWAQGWVIGKIDGLRDGSTGVTNANVQQSFLDMLEAHKGRHAMAFDSKDEVQVIASGGEGHQIVRSLLEYVDGAIEGLVLHGSLPTGGGPTDVGSYARAQVEADSGDILTTYDRTCLEDPLTKQFVALVHDMNEPVRVAMGLARARCPSFVIGAEILPDPTARIDIATKLNAMGVDLKKEELYEGTGFTMPAEGDEVLAGRMPIPVGFGADGGSPFGGGRSFTSSGDPDRDEERSERPEETPAKPAEDAPPKKYAEEFDMVPAQPQTVINRLSLPTQGLEAALREGGAAVAAQIREASREAVEALRDGFKNLPIPQVNVEPAEVVVHAPVTVESPDITVQPAPVTVLPGKAPEVKVDVHVPETKPAAVETETTVTKRDGEGRIQKYRTKPVKE